MLFNNYRTNPAEHDNKNYQGRALYYLPKPTTEADKTNQDLDNNSRHRARIESNDKIYFQAYNVSCADENNNCL